MMLQVRNPNNSKWLCIIKNRLHKHLCKSLQHSKYLTGLGLQVQLLRLCTAHVRSCHPLTVIRTRSLNLCSVPNLSGVRQLLSSDVDSQIPSTHKLC